MTSPDDIQMTERQQRLTHSDYTIAWICALPQTEFAAAVAMLDEEHPLLDPTDEDGNSYVFGKIGDHNVLIACLSAETTGKASAATVASNMLDTFSSIRFGLMVGVGGGAPYYGVQGNNNTSDDEQEGECSEDEEEAERDIRLGDVVIGLHSESAEAVVQYDFGQSIQGKGFVRTGTLDKPPLVVQKAIDMLMAILVQENNLIDERLNDTLSRNPGLACKFCYPALAKDRLFKSEIMHSEGKRTCKSCCGPHNVNLVWRGDRDGTHPQIHYGTIGSADQVMKDAVLRDTWAEKEKIICFEMEAAGLMDSFPCVVIRGICDYADSHKNKRWQQYAALTAAAYAKELVLALPAQDVLDLRPIKKSHLA